MRGFDVRMLNFLRTAAAYVLGNAVGLFITMLLLPGFSITLVAFVIVTAVFSLICAVLDPLVKRLAESNLPSLMGGVALVVTFLGLLITEILITGFTIGGIANLLAATLLVWLSAVIAGVVIPRYVLTGLQPKTK